MIQGNERLIIILGMAHSGTTVIAYTLRQHPNIICCINGTEANLLENDWLLLRQTEPIQTILNNHPEKKVLLKRPWNEIRHPAWMFREMPDAHYIYCFREFNSICKSWSKSTSLVDKHVRLGCPEYKREFYDECLLKGQNFCSKVNSFIIDNDDFIKDSNKVITDVSKFIGLEQYDFDTSKVVDNGDIKSQIRSYF